MMFFFGGGGILVPQPGIEPGPPAVEAQSPNHWTAREFLYDVSDSYVLFPKTTMYFMADTEGLQLALKYI